MHNVFYLRINEPGISKSLSVSGYSILILFCLNESNRITTSVIMPISFLFLFLFAELYGLTQTVFRETSREYSVHQGHLLPLISNQVFTKKGQENT